MINSTLVKIIVILIFPFNFDCTYNNLRRHLKELTYRKFCNISVYQSVRLILSQYQTIY